jgi:glycyl-tRNA synthetase beta chain
MKTATLLIELLTEELPPKSLGRLSTVFCEEVVLGLKAAHLLDDDYRTHAYSTPRRLALSVTRTISRAPDRVQAEKIMPVAVALDAEGKPSAALKKKLSARKIPESEIPNFTRRMDGKSETFFYDLPVAGEYLTAALPAIVETALKRLPVAKMMRWGDSDTQFVRPVHGLILMHGSDVIAGEVLGLQSGRSTKGHRFMSTGEINISNADDYEATLEKDGRVIADFAKRRAQIDTLLQTEARKHRAALGDYRDLLDEVTALVEHPSVYVGAFDPQFLAVPQECLILTMRQNQKYFPLFDADGKLMHHFLIVSNMQLDDPSHVINGNQRVVRPRLEDARFFFDQDRLERLETRVPRLAKVVYHNKLGSQLDRIQRVQLLSGRIARLLETDPVQAERAAWLAKADLVTGMVGEFPELQGIMGRYYALHDGEPGEVCDAIAQHYQPRFAGDRLPDSPVACSVALADKLETLAGMFGIGQTPTGDRDPFALRRHALGVVRILVERNLSLRLDALVKDAFSVFAGDLKLGDAHADLETFIFERMRGYFTDQDYSNQHIDAVLDLRPVSVHRIPLQLAAVRAFAALPEAASLAASNKRVSNILKQAEAKGEAGHDIDEQLLREPAEQALHRALKQAATEATPLFERGDYTAYLKTFAILKTPVDAFFDGVMVMAEDSALRRNRIALLAGLRREMNRIADIAKLAV